MTDNPYASPAPESNPAPLKSQWKINLLTVLSTIVIGCVVIALFIPASRRGRESGRRSQCKNNLKQIGLCLHNYHDTYGAFPPAYTVDANGKRLHSWRTLILPYLDQSELYKKIDLSKPWDDPINAKFAETQVFAFRCPSASIANTHTSYAAIVGDGACFPGAASKSLVDIQDGSDNTLQIVEVETEKSVSWMSPTDVSEQYFLDLEPKSKASHTGGTHSLFADGSVRFLSYNLDQKVRSALMTIAGHEVVGDF